MWWRLEVSDGSFLLITLTKPEKLHGSLKVVMVPSLWKEPLRSRACPGWPTWRDNKPLRHAELFHCRSTDQGQDVLGSGIVTLGPSCKHTHTHTYTHMQPRKILSWLSKWPLIILAVLKQCPQFVSIKQKQKSILSTEVYINGSLFCIQDQSWIFHL